MKINNNLTKEQQDKLEALIKDNLPDYNYFIETANDTGKTYIEYDSADHSKEIIEINEGWFIDNINSDRCLDFLLVVKVDDYSVTSNVPYECSERYTLTLDSFELYVSKDDFYGFVEFDFSDEFKAYLKEEYNRENINR